MKKIDCSLINFYKKFLFVSFIFLIAATIFAAPPIPDFRPQFQMLANDDLSIDDFYELKGNLRIEFPITDDIDVIFKSELDKYKFDVEEISAQYTYDKINRFKIGKFENPLTLDDYIGTFEMLFARQTVVTRDIKKQGYVAKSTGLRYEKRDNKRDDFSYFGHFIYIPSQLEPQIDAGFLFREKDEKKLAGIFASYYPFVTHKNSDKTNFHNFLTDLFFMDYTGWFIYGAEFTIGSSLINPVGLINYQTDTEYPVFMGLDLHAGIKFYLSRNMTWLPVVRVTSFHPDVSDIICRDVDIVWGNQFEYKRNVKLHFDGGIGFVTRHDIYDSDKLKTKYELRWAVSIVIKGN
jgi:hypothetical protein